MTLSERPPQSSVPTPPDGDPSCPALGRFWDVALGGSWAPGERRHVASCPRCQATERTIGSAVVGRASDDHDPARETGDDSGQDPELALAEVRTSPMLSMRVGAVRRRLSVAWGEDHRARIEDAPGLVDETERRTMLRELLDIEMALSRKLIDDRADVDEFMMRSPEDAGSIDESGFAGPDLTWSGGRVTGMPGESVSMSTQADLDTTDQITGSWPIRARESSQMPRSLGDYQVLRVLGSGGMGTVYLARDVALGRLVALKVIRHFDTSDGRSMERFLRSARITAGLSHPSIVPIYNVGQVDGRLFIVSQYIEGNELSALMRQAGRVPPGDAARIVGEVAEALHCAHEQGVIHRDVKPSNIMVDSGGHALLTDFGLARSLVQDDEVSFTIEGDVVGTPAYMSPEQIEGRLDAVGPAADVYSLGATLYTILAGRPPFAGKSAMETLHLTLVAEPPPLRRLDRLIPRDLEVICLKAMAKDPARRYATARAMAEDLQRFLDGRPIFARPPAMMKRLALWLRRRGAWLAPIVLACAGLALVANRQFELQDARRHLGAAEEWRAIRRAINRSHEAELRREIAIGEARIRDRSASREGRRELASSYHRLGDLLVNSDRLVDAGWAYERAVTLLRQDLREAPRDEASRIEMADVLVHWADASRALGWASEARAAYDEALDIRRALVADHPEVRAYRDELGRTLDRLNRVSGSDGPGGGTHAR